MLKEPMLRFTVRRPNSRQHTLEVDAGSALVGTGAHCEVRLAKGECDDEQLLITTSEQGLRATGRGIECSTTLDGRPFFEGIVPDGAEFRFRECSVCVRQAEPAAQAGTSGKPSLSPLSAAVIALIVPGIVAMLVLAPGGSRPLPARPEVPRLWSSEGAAACPQTARDEAEAWARQQWEAGRVKQERSPYHLADGVAAVSLLREAEVCFQQAGLSDVAQGVSESSRRLELQLSAEYHVRQVRLERALAKQSWATAAAEADSLRQLLAGREGPFATWLGNVGRVASLKAEAQAVVNEAKKRRAKRKRLPPGSLG